MEMPRPQDRVIAVASGQEDAPEFIMAFEREVDGFHVYVAYTPAQALQILNEHSSWMLRSDLYAYERLHTLFSNSPAYGEYVHTAPPAIHIQRDVAMRLAVGLGIHSQQIPVGEPLKYTIHDSIAWALIPEEGEESDGIGVVVGVREGIYQVYFVHSRWQIRALAEQNRNTIHSRLYQGLCDAAGNAVLPEVSRQETRILTGGNAALIAESYIYVTEYFRVLRKRRSDPDGGIFSKN